VIAGTVTDGRGKTNTSSGTVTVDNTAPSTSVLAPAPDRFFKDSLPVQAHASDFYGVASVQFAIDGAPVGQALSAADNGAPYTYSTTLDLAGIAGGSHKLTVVATDNAGNKATSAPTGFSIGTAAPTVTISTPPDWSFARGVAPITAAVTGGTSPVNARLVVDGADTGQTVAVAPYVFQWSTTALKAGTHTVAVRVVDAQGRSATSPTLNLTVDNAPPVGFTIAPTANQRVSGPITFKVHASDTFGVASVQFLVDGARAGAAVTMPDAGETYLYSTNYDTTPLTPGVHAVSAVITDNAGNQTTLAPVSMKTGPMQYLPVLNYHEISPPDGYSPYNQTPQEADQQLGVAEGERLPVGHHRPVPAVAAGEGHRSREAGADHRRRRAQVGARLGPAAGEVRLQGGPVRGHRLRRQQHARLDRRPEQPHVGAAQVARRQRPLGDCVPRHYRFEVRTDTTISQFAQAMQDAAFAR
jgi:hypothetical protein